MFRNYLTVALRNLIRHKLYSVINIAGLAMGLACVLFIILYARDELSYDTWVPDSANLYRAELTIYPPGRPPLDLAVIPFPMPATMRDEIPGVTGMTRLWSEPMTLKLCPLENLREKNREFAVLAIRSRYFLGSTSQYG